MQNLPPLTAVVNELGCRIAKGDWIEMRTMVIPPAHTEQEIVDWLKAAGIERIALGSRGERSPRDYRHMSKPLEYALILPSAGGHDLIVEGENYFHKLSEAGVSWRDNNAGKDWAERTASRAAAPEAETAAETLGEEAMSHPRPRQQQQQRDSHTSALIEQGNGPRAGIVVTRGEDGSGRGR